MKWLIVEDALRDNWGHWVEYLRTFQRGLDSCGDELTILCDRGADPDLVAEFNAKPVLPHSIWHRMSDGAGALKRYARVPGHGFATLLALRRVLRQRSVAGRELRVTSGYEKSPMGDREQMSEDRGQSSVFSQPETRHALPATKFVPDIIFVPTVLVHHLLGWWILLKTRSVPKQSKVLLFFPNLPLRIDEKGEARWNSAPTTKLMVRLFRAMRPWIEERRVILGAETKAMRSALAQLTGLPVLYLPHPVEAELKPEVAGDESRVTGNDEKTEVAGEESRVAGEELSVSKDDKPVTRDAERFTAVEPILFACYGGARAEKGSDVFQEAIRLILADEAAGGKTNLQAATAIGRPPRFAIQWIEDFAADDGTMVRLSDDLAKSDRVEVIARYFAGCEYARQLAQTEVMVLPYQSRSYRVRVSRVVIEAMVHGLPVVTTEGTTMWSQVCQFGAGLPYVEGDALSLAEAIRKMAADFADYAAAAQSRAPQAREHFSVATFRKLLLDYISADRLVLGDSHVAGWDWASEMESTWGYGMPGATSQQVLERVRRWHAGSADRLVLWVGTNDVLQGVSPENAADNVGALLKEWHKGRCAVVLEVPPLGRNVERAGRRNELIRSLNDLLAHVARRAGAQFVRWSSAVTDGDGFLSGNFTTDGTHLNEHGYNKVAAAMTAGTKI